jgi:hypothetical protein
MGHRVGGLVRIRPPFRPGIDKMLQQRAQIMLADVGQHGQQRRAFRRVRCRGPFRQQAVAHLVLQLAGALQERRAPWQSGFQRRAFQEIEEPAVKGRYRRPWLCGQHRFQQPARARQQRLDRAIRHRALAQKYPHRRVVRQRQQLQPLVQTVGHLLRRLAREGDRQQLRGFGPRQQQTQHARHQQPGLAAAGAGLDHHRAGRIERGRGVERFTHPTSPCGTVRALHSVCTHRRCRGPAMRHVGQWLRVVPAGAG